MRHVLFAVLLVGCARGGVGNPAQDDANGQVVIDGTVYEDAPDHEFHDAKVYQDAHEFQDAHVYMDAHVFMDACVPVQTQLLQNANLDTNPPGTLWGSVPIDPAYPVVTDQDGLVEQSAPFKAWLGGFADGGTDSLWQDVTVPVGTTALVFSGYSAVGTDETSTTTAYDIASVSLRTTTNAMIENVANFSNLTPQAAWTPFQHSFTNVSAGQTVRIYFTSTSDTISNATSFFFDTFSLVATHCP